MKKNKLVLLFSAVLIFMTNGFCLGAEKEYFSLLPFKVGQYAEYQIVSLENLSQGNRYIISVIGEESLNGQKYFWIKLDIYGDNIREISFKALVPSYNSSDFAKNPDIYISEGLFYLFKKAKRMIIISRDTQEYEIDKDEFLCQPNILEGTFYEDMPDEKNCVDYSKLKYSEKSETIKMAVDSFQCFHFWVSTADTDEYSDEGFDLWRSPVVPFLGIVKMEFSKTEYFKKFKYKRKKILEKKNRIERFFSKFFLKNVDREERKDMYIMTLVGTGG